MDKFVVESEELRQNLTRICTGRAQESGWLEQLLSSGLDANYEISLEMQKPEPSCTGLARNFTILQLASLFKVSSVVEILLREEDIDVNRQQVETGRTALHEAANQGSLECLKLLLNDHRTNPNLRDKSGDSALDDARFQGHTEAADLLIKHPKFTHDYEKDLQKTLKTICEGNTTQLNFLRRHLEYGLDSNFEVPVDLDHTGLLITMLHLACYYDVPEVAKLLLTRNKIQVNKRQDRTGRTALHAAACQGSLECLKLLLDDNRIDLNVCDDAGDTLLDDALYQGHSGAVALLKAHPRVVFDRDIELRNKLKKICRGDENDTSFLERQLRSRFNPNYELSIPVNCIDGTTRTRRFTLLHLASYYNVSVVVRLLLSVEGICVNKQQDETGRTALHEAVFRGSLDCVQLLLNDHRIDVSLRDSAGYTPLEGNRSSVKHILSPRPTLDRSSKFLARVSHYHSGKFDGKSGVTKSEFITHQKQVEEMFAKHKKDIADLREVIGERKLSSTDSSFIDLHVDLSILSPGPLTPLSNEAFGDWSQEVDPTYKRVFFLVISNAHALENWKFIGRSLNISEDNIKNIDDRYQHQGLKEKLYQTLLMWRVQFGQSAGFDRLIEALEVNKLIGLVDEIKQLTEQKPPLSPA